MTKEDYMRLPKERLAELLAERDVQQRPPVKWHPYQSACGIDGGMCIIKDIKWERANTPVTVDKDIRKYDKQINWLKSLRPQPKWKPSEEQMETLKRASTNEYVSAKQFDILVSLYKQLKKLMEE